jgi:hypothetical protein
MVEKSKSQLKSQYEGLMRTLQLLEDAGDEGTEEYQRIMAEARTLVPLLYGLPKNDPSTDESEAAQG